MGYWPTSGTSGAYASDSMGQEELHTWILSAGLYWSHSGDQAWLTDNLSLLQTCLDSMLLRDSTNATARDGITRNVELRRRVPRSTTWTPRCTPRSTAAGWR